MTPEDEAAVRRIVREELTLMLNSMKKETVYLNSYETGELEAAALYAMGNVTDRVLGDLPHAADCASRSDKLYVRCSCGVQEY